jgi:hypothetical protein
MLWTDFLTFLPLPLAFDVSQKGLDGAGGKEYGRESNGSTGLYCADQLACCGSIYIFIELMLSILPSDLMISILGL